MPALKEFNIYLAGPEVFLPDPVAKGADKRAAIARFNQEVLHDKNFRFVGHYPLDAELDFYTNTPRTAMQIFHACIEFMNKTDLIIANITHFRGPSADVGTVFEMGYMYAQQKPVFVYYDAQETYCADREAAARDAVAPNFDAHTTYIDKVRAFAAGYLVDRAPAEDRDNDNFMIEDFGLADNPMLIGAAKAGVREAHDYAPAESFWAALQEAATSIEAEHEHTCAP